MTKANSINAATTGIVGNTGTGFTATALTQYLVNCGGATSSTISQVVGTGTSGQVLTSNGAGALPTWQDVPGGGIVPNLVYITSQTASSSTNLDFTGLSSTYKGYRFYIEALTVNSGAISGIRCSTNNGSTYDSSSVYTRVGSSDVTAFGSANNAGYPFFNNSAATTKAISGYVDVYFTTTANAFVTFESRTTVDTPTGGNNGDWGAGNYRVQANVNALRFTSFGSGSTNFTSGTIYQFGIL